MTPGRDADGPPGGADRRDTARTEGPGHGPLREVRPMDSSSSDRDPIEALAEEFLARRRRGERPTIEEYAARYPALARVIRAVFPAMALVAELGPATASTEDGPTGSAVADGPARHVAESEHVGDYRIVREIGRGGMGVVYEAEQVSLGRRVALKLLPKRAPPRPKHRGRFEREARAAAKLHHTNIVPVFGVGEHEGAPYYVMQLIEGRGLDAVIRELRRQPGRRRATAPTSISPDRPATEAEESRSPGPRRGRAHGRPDRPARAASRPTRPDAATERTRADRRTHPSADPPPPMPAGPIGGRRRRVATPRASATSSLGRDRGSPAGAAAAAGLLAGRGPARRPGRRRPGLRPRPGRSSTATSSPRTSSSTPTARPGSPTSAWPRPTTRTDLTETGDVLGTLRYMPPEAFEGRSDPSSDLYSLGLTLYELIALRPAFDQPDRARLVRAVTRASRRGCGSSNPRSRATWRRSSARRSSARRRTDTRRPPEWPRTCSGSSTTGRSRPARSGETENSALVPPQPRDGDPGGSARRRADRHDRRLAGRGDVVHRQAIAQRGLTIEKEIERRVAVFERRRAEAAARGPGGSQ